MVIAQKGSYWKGGDDLFFKLPPLHSVRPVSHRRPQRVGNAVVFAPAPWCFSELQLPRFSVLSWYPGPHRHVTTGSLGLQGPNTWAFKASGPCLMTAITLVTGQCPLSVERRHGHCGHTIGAPQLFLIGDGSDPSPFHGVSLCALSGRLRFP